jgi:hypothetical protein
MPTECQQRGADCQGALEAFGFTRVFEPARLVLQATPVVDARAT